MGGAGAIPLNPELLELAETSNTKAVDLMMDWAHGPAGHFGGHQAWLISLKCRFNVSSRKKRN